MLALHAVLAAAPAVPAAAPGVPCAVPGVPRAVPGGVPGVPGAWLAVKRKSSESIEPVHLSACIIHRIQKIGIKINNVKI